MENIQLRNHVRILGKGKQTLVFGHGFGCSQTTWQSILPYFEEDYRVVLFDYVGSGQSDFSAYQKDRYQDLYGYAQDLSEVLDYLNCEPVVFIGHSVSAMIGLITSIQKPELFKGMVMIGPSARYQNDLPDYYGGFSKSDIDELLMMMEKNFAGWASANAADFIKTPEQPEFAKQLEQTFQAQDPIIMRDFAAATFLSDHRKELPLATIPTFILQCCDDSVVPVEATNYLHEHIKGSELKLIDTKGHYPQVVHPEETAKIIQNYIDRILK